MSDLTAPSKFHEANKAISSAVSIDLDLLRGVAALLVFVSHWRSLFYADFGGHGHSVLANSFYFLTGFGHESVVVFFVLSGYFVGGSVSRALSKGRWSWKNYLIERGTRLYMVLVPALAFGYALDRSGHAMFGEHGAYGGGGIFASIFTGSIASHLAPTTIVGNLLFFQTILVPTAGSNGPLWSLANEFWYYICFPLLVLAFTASLSKPVRFACLAGSIAVLVFVRFNIAALFPVWALGAVLAIWPAPAFLKSAPVKWIAFMVWLLAMAWCRVGHFKSPLEADAMLAVATTFWVATLLTPHSQTRPNSLAKFSKFLSATSYTCYLFHVPFLVFLSAWLVPDGNRVAFSGRVQLAPLVALLATGIYVVVAWALFERNTHLLRSKVRTWLQVSPAPTRKAEVGTPS